MYSLQIMYKQYISSWGVMGTTSWDNSRLRLKSRLESSFARDHKRNLTWSPHCIHLLFILINHNLCVAQTTLLHVFVIKTPLLLQTQVLRVEQVNEPCIGLTQENSIENSVQNCLSYILKPHGPCYSTSSLP